MEEVDGLLSDCAELAEKGKPSTLETLRDEIIGMNIFNSVFVDCTASAAVASLYKDLLLHNVSVVAANWQPASCVQLP